MKAFGLTLASSILFQISFGQLPDYPISTIDSLVRHIDSTNVKGSITDFSLYKKGHRKNRAGQGAYWFYTDTSRKKLVKVICEISLKSETFDTYYFQRDTLIYFISKNYTVINKKNTLNWARECYFFNQKLILIQENTNNNFDSKLILDKARSFFIGDQIWKDPFSGFYNIE